MTESDLVAAAQAGDIDQVKHLIQLGVDPSADDNHAIGAAAQLGHAGVVGRLLQDARVDPSAAHSYALRAAASGGHVAVVSLLLQDARVEPSAWWDSDALSAAAECGHVCVVERLLQDLRVDPAADNNYALRSASRNGHMAVVERLLLEPRIDKFGSAVVAAAAGGQLAIVERLLRDQRGVDGWYLTRALSAAAENDRLAVVERLLQDERIDPANDRTTLRQALKRGRVAMVDRLLLDLRVDPDLSSDDDDGDNGVIFDAAANNTIRLQTVYVGLSEIGMIRSRATAVCNGLHGLDLPALITLEILDALIPNSIRMAAKWDLIVAVKHFHNRP